MANFRVYYQDCPTVSIKDCNESAMVRDTIKKSMERKRFVVKDENDTIICLVRFVKDEKPMVGLPNYEIAVFNRTYNLMFTRQTDSKKWDTFLESDAKGVVEDIVRLYELKASGRIEAINEQYKALVAKSISDSLDWVKSIGESDIDASLELKEWYIAPTGKDFTDENVKWYYNLYGGEDHIKNAVSKELTKMGFTFRSDYIGHVKMKDYLCLTTSGVMDNMSEAVYDCCIDKQMASIQETINTLGSIDDLNELTDIVFKQDWGRLAVERLGGKKRVVSELVKPRAKAIAECEIGIINDAIASLESEIADYRTKIEKYQQYLS